MEKSWPIEGEMGLKEYLEETLEEILEFEPELVSTCSGGSDKC